MTTKRARRLAKRGDRQGVLSSSGRKEGTRLHRQTVSEGCEEKRRTPRVFSRRLKIFYERVGGTKKRHSSVDAQPTERRRRRRSQEESAEESTEKRGERRSSAGGSDTKGNFSLFTRSTSAYAFLSKRTYRPMYLSLLEPCTYRASISRGLGYTRPYSHLYFSMERQTSA